MNAARRAVARPCAVLLGGAVALVLGAGVGADAEAAGHDGHVPSGGHATSGHHAPSAGHVASAGDVASAGHIASAGHARGLPAGVNPVSGAAARIRTALRAAGTRSNPGRLLVTATEFRLALSRPTVGRGVVVVQLLVAGEDPHDLALQRLDRRGRPTGRRLHIPRVTPDALGEGEFRLAAGTWRLTCTLPGHARMGMKATLRVR